MIKPHFYFWQGFFTHLGLIMCYQDWIGLDEYLRVVKAGWMDLHWTVGFTIALIALGSHFLFRWALADYRKDHPEK